MATSRAPRKRFCRHKSTRVQSQTPGRAEGERALRGTARQAEEPRPSGRARAGRAALPSAPGVFADDYRQTSTEHGTCYSTQTPVSTWGPAPLRAIGPTTPTHTCRRARAHTCGTHQHHKRVHHVLADNARTRQCHMRKHTNPTLAAIGRRPSEARGNTTGVPVEVLARSHSSRTCPRSRDIAPIDAHTHTPTHTEFPATSGSAGASDCRITTVSTKHHRSGCGSADRETACNARPHLARGGPRSGTMERAVAMLRAHPHTLSASPPPTTAQWRPAADGAMSMSPPSTHAERLTQMLDRTHTHTHTVHCTNPTRVAKSRSRRTSQR